MSQAVVSSATWFLWSISTGISCWRWCSGSWLSLSSLTPEAFEVAGGETILYDSLIPFEGNCYWHGSHAKKSDHLHFASQATSTRQPPVGDSCWQKCHHSGQRLVAQPVLSDMQGSESSGAEMVRALLRPVAWWSPVTFYFLSKIVEMFCVINQDQIYCFYFSKLSRNNFKKNAKVRSFNGNFWKIWKLFLN